MKLLRNKYDKSKLLYKLTHIGDTCDKYDTSDYKDIIFEQPIPIHTIIDSFKGIMLFKIR